MGDQTEALKKAIERAKKVQAEIAAIAKKLREKED